MQTMVVYGKSFAMVKVYGDLTNHLKSLANDGLKYTYILATGIPTPTVFGIF